MIFFSREEEVMKSYFFFIFFLLTLFSSVEAKISYSVEYQGIENTEILKQIKSVSELSLLRKHQPASFKALEYRAERDIPAIIKVLHAYGYYEAEVTTHFQNFPSKIHVIVLVDPGPLYTIQDFSIHFTKEPEPHSPVWARLELKNLRIQLGAPALATQIEQAEMRIKEALGKSGYPLFQILKKEIKVDGKAKGVFIYFEIDPGSLCYFGTTSFHGLKSVKPLFLEQKIPWKEGDLYNSELVDTTQEILLQTGLFGAAFIDPAEKPSDDSLLPIEVEVTETKHKSANVGVSYQTYWGPGMTFGWENRNVSGMGRKISMQGDINTKSVTGVATYLYPNFLWIGQDQLWKAEALHESIRPYKESSYNVMDRFDWKISKKMHASLGGKLERMIVTDSVHDDKYVLFSLPGYLRWSSANNLLNPTKGMTIEYRFTPTMNVSNRKQNYLSQELSYSLYKSFDKNKILLFAQKVTIYSTLSREYEEVPVPQRIFGGSEETLRGYHYFTVSPLEGKKPKGGRSGVFYSFEPRLKVFKNFGIVPFYDLGNVYESMAPNFKGRWFSSVGFGLRYFSFMGPLRADMGFPLYRREDVDPKFRILVSIGQSF